jgi:signal transduction histidine kinase
MTNTNRMIAVIAHELRSPLSAILGFQELIADGLLGNIDDAALDGVMRIRNSALQLLTLTQGLEDLGGGTSSVTLGPVAIVAVLEPLARRLDDDAAARNVVLTWQPAPTRDIRAEHERIARIFELVIHAAFKARSGSTIRVDFEESARETTIRFDGGAITSLPDVPDISDARAADLNGVTLRLAIVASIARSLASTLRRAHDGAVLLTFPHVEP